MSIATCGKVIWAGEIGPGILWWMRDDKATGIVDEQRYSLFRTDFNGMSRVDYGRLMIFTGERTWALQEAWKFIEKYLTTHEL